MSRPAATVHRVVKAYDVRGLVGEELDEVVEPDEVASLAGWLASDRAGMATGSSYTLDGGWTAR